MKHSMQRHLTNKATEAFKFCFTVALLCFFIDKAPNEASQVVNIAAAFVLGSAGAKSNWKI
jgi:hypothetical protein